MKKFKNYYSSALNNTKITFKNKNNFFLYYCSFFIRLLSIPLFIFKPYVSLASVNLLKQADRTNKIDLPRCFNGVGSIKQYWKLAVAWLYKILVLIGKILFICAVAFAVYGFYQFINSIAWSFNKNSDLTFVLYLFEAPFAIWVLILIFKDLVGAIPLRYVLDKYPDASIMELIEKSEKTLSKNHKKILVGNFIVGLLLFALIGCGYFLITILGNLEGNLIGPIVSSNGGNATNINGAFNTLNIVIYIACILLFSPRVLLKANIVAYNVYTDALNASIVIEDYSDIEIRLNNNVRVKKNKLNGVEFEITDLFDEELEQHLNETTEHVDETVPDAETEVLTSDAAELFETEAVEEQVISDETLVAENITDVVESDETLETPDEEVVVEEPSQIPDDVQPEESTEEVIQEAAVEDVPEVNNETASEEQTVTEEQSTPEVETPVEEVAEVEITDKDLKPYLAKAKAENTKIKKDNAAKVKEINGRLKEIDKTVAQLDKVRAKHPENVDPDVYDSLIDEKDVLTTQLEMIDAYVEKDITELAKELYLADHKN